MTTLRTWYKSEDLRQDLGAVCKLVQEHSEETFTYGTRSDPCIRLRPVNDSDHRSATMHLRTVGEAKSEWDIIVPAVAFMDQSFLITYQSRPTAVIERNSAVDHPARKYKLSRLESDLREVCDKFEDSVEKIVSLEKHIVNLHRELKGLPAKHSFNG